MALGRPGETGEHSANQLARFLSPLSPPLPSPPCFLCRLLSFELMYLKILGPFHLPSLQVYVPGVQPNGRPVHPLPCLPSFPGMSLSLVAASISSGRSKILCEKPFQSCQPATGEIMNILMHCSSRAICLKSQQRANEPLESGAEQGLMEEARRRR